MNTRKQKAPPTTTVTVRIPVDVAARLEEEARADRQRTGDNVGRSDLIRQAIDDLLAAREQ
jgi:Arc/MetJ-type ribon-helix-helix transcriptional regulator